MRLRKTARGVGGVFGGKSTEPWPLSNPKKLNKICASCPLRILNPIVETVAWESRMDMVGVHTLVWIYVISLVSVVVKGYPR